MVKKGFTLFEALIIISVVGVIAAILLPNVKKIMPSNNRVMFKKAYATLEQTINTLIYDNVNYPEYKVVDIEGKEVSRGFNFTTKIDGTYYPRIKFCTLFSDLVNTVGSVNCPAAQTATWWKGEFTTTDGIHWIMLCAGGDNHADMQFPTYLGEGVPLYNLHFVVDVNGVNKKPNCSADTMPLSIWLAPWPGPDLNGIYKNCDTPSPGEPDFGPCQRNPDTFLFSVRYDGKIRIGASSDACANEILSDPTKFTK